MNSLYFYESEIRKAKGLLENAEGSGDPVLIKKFKNDIYNYEQMLKQYLSANPAKKPKNK